MEDQGDAEINQINLCNIEDVYLDVEMVYPDDEEEDE